MSDALSFAELDGQRVELLEARTVLGLLDILGAGDAFGGDGGSQTVDQVRQGDGDGSLNNSGANGGAATGGKLDLLKGALS